MVAADLLDGFGGHRWLLRKGEPGIYFLGINQGLAGLGGRNAFRDTSAFLATAVGIGEPGKYPLDIISTMAGLGGRTRAMGISCR
jgi:hypothetical protein